jgi:hypothetical protein
MLHHPAFQSLLLPALLALMAVGLLRLWPAGGGRHGAAQGAVAALLLSLALLPGLHWPATTAAHKLPWIVLAALLPGLAARAWARAGAGDPRTVGWLGAIVCWLAASVWLAGDRLAWLPTGITALAGAAVLLLVTISLAPRPADLRPATAVDAAGTAVAAALTVAALGLAALAAGGGSLLLAQLALMVATVTAVPGLWSWLRPASGPVLGGSTLLPLAVAWLTMASLMPAAGAAGWARVGLLALAFVAPALVARHAGLASRPRWAGVVVVALAALPVALALVWQLTAGTAGTESPGQDDDPYYQPQRP